MGLVHCDIDLQAEGKQFGNILIPRSTNSAGWAKYYVPIVSLRNGGGPKAVLFGGNHGDEYEGPVTLLNLARLLNAEQIKGQLIIVPMLNRPAVVGGTRLSPIDGMNMNRAYPGSESGTLTSMIAHFVSSTLLPGADLVIDIHSGGSSMHMLPSVNMHELENNEQMERMLAAGKAWRAPYVFLYRDVAGAGLLPSYSEGLGITTLGTEVGSKAQFGVEMLRITKHGVNNVLRWAGVMQGDEVEGDGASRVVAANKDDDYVMAPVSGILEPLVELGDSVTAGQTVGRIHSFERIDQEPMEVRALTDGFVFARRAIPKTEQGECVIVVTRDV